MLKHAADLSDSHEYFIVWAGETNARPWGTKASAYSLYPEFEPAADGVDLTGLVIPDNGSRSTAVSEELTVGSPTLTANEWANCRLRMGTETVPILGYGTIESNTASKITVNWTVLPANNATVAAYIVRENRKWGSYPQVRILTPYQPVVDDTTDTDVGYPTPSAVTTTRSLTLPAPYNGTTGATSHEDIGVLLPLSFREGIDGFGISESKDSAGSTAHAFNSIPSDGSSLTFDNGLAHADIMNGGYLIIDWLEDSGTMKRSWASITDSTETVLVVENWLGDSIGDASTGLLKGSVAATRAGRIKHYTAWIPHYNDSPYAYLPGEGFTYPNNDMQPCAASGEAGAAIHNKPRNKLGSAYGDKFGELLVTASRLSAAIGKRVNVVHLGVNNSSLVPSNGRNVAGFPGKLGWWDFENHGTWAPNNSDSI